MPTRRSRAFCEALHQEIGDDPQRWTTITAVADRMGIDQDKAEALAAELDAAGLVRVGGGLSVILEEAGRQLAKDAAKPAPSSRQGRQRPAGASARGAGSSGTGSRRRKTRAVISQGGTQPPQ
jgi:hypothetical protein